MKRTQFIVGFQLLLLAQLLFAQEEIIPVRRTPFLLIGTRFQTWRIQYENKPVNQINAPLSLIVPVSEKLQFQISNTPAVSWWQEKRSITGPSDTWIQGSLIVGDNLGIINLGVGTPTGKTELNNEQFLISQQFLSRNIFEFGLPVYGQGLTLKAGALFAQKISNQVILGVGGQYLAKGTYKPVQYNISYQAGNQVLTQTYSPKYRPGNEVSGQVGLDVLMTKDFKIMFDVMYTHYFRDLLEGEEIFGSGDKIILKSSAYYRYSDKYLWGQILYRYKGKNEIRPGFTFVDEQYRLTGYQCEVNFYAQFSSVENAKLYTVLNGKYYGKNELGYYGGNVSGGGVGVQFESTKNSVFDFCVKYLAGSFNSYIIEGMDISISMGVEF